jgi:hypothetical protein
LFLELIRLSPAVFLARLSGIIVASEARPGIAAGAGSTF